LLYRSGDLSIDVRVVPSKDNRFDLLGQVLKEDDTTFESVSQLQVSIHQQDTVLFSTVTDDMGEFGITGIDPGDYSLRVELPEGTITVSEVPLRSW
jgi:uncharacterized surface anchored protein